MEPSRDDFCHPYQPYDIQLEFMRNLYRCLEDGNIGIFESPTGTGKSLSLICGALTWLRDHARQEIEGTFTETGDDGDWLVAAEKATQRREFLRGREELESKLLALRQKETARQNAPNGPRPTKQARTALANTSSSLRVNDDEFMLDDYVSDQDIKGSGGTAFSSSTQALLDRLKPIARDSVNEDEVDRVKIIFCSRTHSQLTQFIHELRRVRPPSALPQDGKARDVGVDEVVKHLPLGSRKNLCINPRVSRLPTTIAINERCLELQKPGTAKEHKCKYLPTKDDRERKETFRDRAISTIRDIEDIASLGQRMELCPYYASRSAIVHSEILTLPYPLLLQKSAREALGVQVKGNIVVIDEAHNLMGAIADTVSVSLSLANLERATEQVLAYAQRFKNKLKGQNRMYVMQVIRLLNSFIDCLRTALADTKQGETAVTARQLMAGKGVDQIRPHKLLEYLIESKLTYKVEGYTDAHEIAASNRPKGILMHVQNFIAVLMNPDAEGHFFVSRQDRDIVVRYTLLDPREHFRDIVENARAVILAGGTMSPMTDYVDYLFSYLEPDRLKLFSFGHVIPRSNLMAEPVTAGLNGVEFDFTFSKRGSEAMIAELGRLVLRVCHTVLDGVVVFFPSYDYLEQVMSVWKRPHNGQSLLDTLANVKQIFEETRGISVDNLLRDYAHAIDKNKGGLMLSVVGGKLSEGINFSDKLGRAVIAVGLPFPNANGAEWKAKTEHIEQLQYKSCKEQGQTEQQSKAKAKAAGRDFYENACMRSINQSIGRAIRHKNDYAAILLVDQRFATERIRKKLPHWIKSSMSEIAQTRKWPSIEDDLKQFFHSKK